RTDRRIRARPPGPTGPRPLRGPNCLVPVYSPCARSARHSSKRRPDQFVPELTQLVGRSGGLRLLRPLPLLERAHGDRGVGIGRERLRADLEEPRLADGPVAHSVLDFPLVPALRDREHEAILRHVPAADRLERVSGPLRIWHDHAVAQPAIILLELGGASSVAAE